MALPDPITDKLRRDRALAVQFDVKFKVVSRREGSGLQSGPPDEHGTFDDPADAVTAGQSLTGRHVTVLADGRGAYWRTADPEVIGSELLRIVCRDKRLGPKEAELERQREHGRDLIERLGADQRLDKAVEIARECEDSDEAALRLQQESPRFSRSQAIHLLTNRHVRLLTRQGQRELQAELDAAVEALGALGPSAEDVD